MSADKGAKRPVEGANFSYIDFEADESPKWRENGSQIPTVMEMIESIVTYQNQWKEQKDSIDEETEATLRHKCLEEFIYRMNIEEGQGCDTKEDIRTCLNIDTTSEKPLSQKFQETVNLINAYKYFLSEVDKDENGKESHGLIEISMVQHAHEMILKDIELPSDATKPGEFSQKERCTEYKGKIHKYPNPPDMEKEVLKLLDIYNDLIDSGKKKENPKDRAYDMFKTCSWLLFELLDLHPFCDGNGRLCRLLCSYALASMTPFPTPIYNVWSESKKNDYIDALVEARKSKNRHPTSLTTMIIDCNYFGWQEFFKILKKMSNEEETAPVETEDNEEVTAPVETEDIMKK